ncbi:MAG: VCBS repeat-containing protein [Candidatus Zixiibacteriota bacterium]|nr:MAG: VCBS repeat-containing protein [candidate division Zixibacteria bacterium]
MNKMKLCVPVLLAIMLPFCGPSVSAQVTGTTPGQNEQNVVTTIVILATFEEDMNEASINTTTFRVAATVTGQHSGAVSYESGTRTAIFTPDAHFASGEMVTVTLTPDIQFTSGPYLENGYLWSFTTAVDNGTGKFTTDSSYPVGSSPRSIAAADLDNDGDIDLATVNYTADNISVLLNNGDGTFADHSTYTAGYPRPYALCAADFDRDGDIDLAAVGEDPYMRRNPEIVLWVTILKNDGNGIFNQYSNFSCGSWISYPIGYQMSICTADFNNDGSCDIAVTSGFDGNVRVLFNNGSGSFGNRVSYIAGSSPVSLIGADVNNDAHIDLVTANYESNNISVLINNGNGSFTGHVDYPSGGHPRSIFSRDLNGDGCLDLAVANQSSDNVSVLINNGNGTFATHIVYAVGNSPSCVRAVDCDRDGDFDLTVANESSATISYLPNNGDGTFAPGEEHAVGHGPRYLCDADFNNDGAIDLATANASSGNVSVLFNELNCCLTWGHPGDANSDEDVNLLDILHIVDYVYQEPTGDPPNPGGCDALLDCNGDGEPVDNSNINLLDILRLVEFIYIMPIGEPEPCCPPGCQKP